MNRTFDITGERKLTWTALERCGRGSRNEAIWLIQCDCGRRKKVRLGNWTMGRGTKTCPCQERPPNYNQLPDGEASFNFLFYGYRKRAAERGYEFSLTKEEFRALTRQDCAYCGRPPSQTRKTTSGTPYTYTGVDRVDPHRGYVADNIAPCCGLCNREKSDLTIDQWRERIGLLAARMAAW